MGAAGTAGTGAGPITMGPLANDDVAKIPSPNTLAKSADVSIRFLI